MTGSGTRVTPRELKAWHLAALLGLVLAIDVAWAVLAW